MSPRSDAPPILSPDEALGMEARCIGLAAQRLARAVARNFDAVFRRVGLSGWQFALLTATARPRAPTISELAERLGMDRTTVSANLKPLVRRGFLTIEPDPDDRRIRRVRQTATGEATLSEALPLWRQIQEGYAARVGAAPLAELRRIARAVSAAA